MKPVDRVYLVFPLMTGLSYLVITEEGVRGGGGLLGEATKTSKKSVGRSVSPENSTTLLFPRPVRDVKPLNHFGGCDRSAKRLNAPIVLAS